MGKRPSANNRERYKEIDDDFEDFGYHIKNIRRYSRKKVKHFKGDDNPYEDS